MTLRRRMTLISALSVAVAICVAAVVTYVAVRAELRGQVDDTLRERSSAIATFTARIPPGGSLEQIPLPPPDAPQALGSSPLYLQVIGPDGSTMDVLDRAGLDLPVDEVAAGIAARGEGEKLEDREVDGSHLRVLTVGLGEDGAFQIARSLEPTDALLSRIRTVLLLVAMGGITLAALLARRGAIRFTSALDALAQSRRRLADSVDAQRQLVADASHELRTPVASLRTDIEVLRLTPGLDGAEREGMLRDIDGRVEELGALITDVIELARGDDESAEPEEVRVDLLVSEALDRARRHAPERLLMLESDPWVVLGRPDRLARAVNNLIDNAVKYSPAGTPIEVTARAGEVTVRDHGPGVPPDERGQVFDRFHRGAGSRRVAGSGLGLAIVRQVAEAHGGSVAVEDAPGGGALFHLRLGGRPVALAPEARALDPIR